MHLFKPSKNCVLFLNIWARPCRTDEALKNLLSMQEDLSDFYVKSFTLPNIVSQVLQESVTDKLDVTRVLQNFVYNCLLIRSGKKFYCPAILLLTSIKYLN